VRKQMSWFKIYPEDWLANGLAVFLSLAESGVFVRLQCAASNSPTRGTIQMAPGEPYPSETLARKLRVKKSILTKTLNKLEKIGRITQDRDGIHITNWLQDQGGVQPPLPGIGDHTRILRKRSTGYQDKVATTAEDVKRHRKEKARRLSKT